MRDRIRAALAAHSPRELPLDGRRESAVMLLLHERDGIDHVLFQLRTNLVVHHRGEISLPGGRRDPGDHTLLATALRETHEEIGVPPEAVEVYGRLDDEETFATAYRITPFVGAIVDEASRPRARAADEVRELLAVPLEHLLSERSHTWKVVDRDGRPEATPAFRHGEHVIWGATARILTRFIEVLDAAPALSGEG